MRFIEVYRKLEQENEGYMLLMRSGIFFIGVGKTAKLLVTKIGLKPICIQEQVCKVDRGTELLSSRFPVVNKLERENVNIFV